jgi:ribonuclease HIII
MEIQINNLIQLKNHWGWKILMDEIEKEKQDIENILIDTFWGETKLKYTEKDFLRLQRLLIIKLQSLPDKIIRRLNWNEFNQPLMEIDNNVLNY